MRILSMKPGHDGSIAYLADGVLQLCVEAEKDSFQRFSAVTPSLVISALSRIETVPDVVCVSGWMKGVLPTDRPLGAGYFGSTETTRFISDSRLLGSAIKSFTSTHERSHLMCAYGMAPYPQGTPCYALVWEGHIGNFYRIDEHVRVQYLGEALEGPGDKYAFLFAVGDPSFPDRTGAFRFDDAGKLMALAAFSDRSKPTPDERRVIDFILSRRRIFMSTRKSELRDASIYNVGVEDERFKAIAGKLSDAIFEKFYTFACKNLTEGLPLVIAGGCGLNCEWNTKWLKSGLFADIFVPPCTNDTGSAIGTAVDAQHLCTGDAKIRWSVYCGEEFVDDVAPTEPFESEPFDLERVARFLSQDKVIAWVHGRCEMGPRALGNRSLLASPFSAEMTRRLNSIKQRESYRPIAPVCLESELSSLTGEWRDSPFMLHFYNVVTPAVPAVTHVDGTARVQSVRPHENPRLFELLSAFKRVTGHGVLCNTSLNMKGRGFINRMSDLLNYATATELDGVVVGDRFWRRRNTALAGNGG